MKISAFFLLMLAGLLCLNGSPGLAQTLSATSTIAPSTTTATIVIIIDDMGNGLERGQQAIALPGPINYAFLPHTPNAKTLAESAHQQGKEVLLHLPMSNVQDYDTGPGTLRPIMEKPQFLQTLQDDLESIPHVRGVNNHMGSLLTQLHEPMDWLMQALKQQQLYFIDSRTSPLTVAESQANALQLPATRRDIFLDNKRNPAAIAQQFERLIALAKQRGVAVAIGHPHPETLAFLQQALPTLLGRGIKLAFASEVLQPNITNIQQPANCINPASTEACPEAIKVAMSKHSNNDKNLTKN
jgi:uncharacterized protein